MKNLKRTDRDVPMVPRSVGLGVAIVGVLVIVGLIATFIVSAF